MIEQILNSYKRKVIFKISDDISPFCATTDISGLDFCDFCLLSFKARRDPLAFELPHLCRMVLIVTFGATYATSHTFSKGYTRILDAQLLMFVTICMPFN